MTAENLPKKNNHTQSVLAEYSESPFTGLQRPPKSPGPNFLSLILKSLKDFNNPIQQLESIQDFDEILKKTYLETDQLQQIFQEFEKITANESISPLYKIIVMRLESCLKSDYGLLDNGEQKSIPDQSFIQDLKNQDQLAQEYPSLTGYPIVMIAPNVAGSHNNYGQITDLAFKNPDEQPNINDILSQEDDSQGVNYYFLINLAHNIEFKPAINEVLNINLSNIPLISQISLLKFMAKADNSRFDKLSKTLQHIDNENLRIALLENFVATDFGEDFGDSLLDIVNSDKISPEQTKAILESIISCRKSIDGITSLYDNFDQGSFSEQYKKASNERLTDIITVFREIGKNGSASADLDWAGSPIFDYDSAMEALEYEKKSLEIINGIMNDVLKRKEGSFAEIVISPQKDKMKRTLYSFYSEKYGYCLLYTRPEGGSVFDPSFEYGNKNGVEASISFITNPKDPLSLPNPFRPNLGKMSHKSTLDKVSAIRLDREGRTKNMAPNDPSRNPINKTGIVSVDLAAIGDGEETPSGKIARLISIGNKLRAKNEKTSLNHNIAHFDQDKYGPEEGFKKIVDYIDKIATQLCKENPPKNTQESFTRLKKQKRGRKILKHTT